MSWKISGLVWELDLTHSQQSVLLAMADHADHEGYKVFPSVARISWKTGYSDRQVRRVMSQLRELKILIIEKEAHRYRPREYRIDISAGKKKPPFRTDTMTGLGHDDNNTPTDRADMGDSPEASDLTRESTRDDIGDRADLTPESIRDDTAMSSKSSKESLNKPSVKQDDYFSILWDKVRYAIKQTWPKMGQPVKQRIDATKLLGFDDGRAIILCLMGDDQKEWLMDRLSKQIERELAAITNLPINDVQFVTGDEIKNETKQE